MGVYQVFRVYFSPFKFPTQTLLQQEFWLLAPSMDGGLLEILTDPTWLGGPELSRIAPQSRQARTPTQGADTSSQLYLMSRGAGYA